MTAEELAGWLQKVPADCVVMSNSGWECDETDIGGLWYCVERNELHFTQGGAIENKYGYKLIGNPSVKFEKLYCVDD